MALSLAEIRDLIAFGRAQGLQTMSIDGVVAVSYGVPPFVQRESEAPPSIDTKEPHLPEELRHYSAVGRAAMGNRGVG